MSDTVKVPTIRFGDVLLVQSVDGIKTKYFWILPSNHSSYKAKTETDLHKIGEEIWKAMHRQTEMSFAATLMTPEDLAAFKRL